MYGYFGERLHVNHLIGEGLTISGLHCFAFLCTMIGQGSMCYVLNQSDAKLKLLVSLPQSQDSFVCIFLFSSYTFSF